MTTTTVYAVITETGSVTYTVPAHDTDDHETKHYQTLTDALASFGGPADLVVAIGGDADMLDMAASTRYYEVGIVRGER